MEDYLKTGVVTTHFMMDCLLGVYDLVRNRCDIEDVEGLTKLLDETAEYEVALRAKIQVQIGTAKLGKKVKEFDEKIWFKGLQDMVLNTNERGISARIKKYNNLKVLTWSGMGRTMVTIEDDHSSVTHVADETSKESRSGLHGICAKSEDAIALYDRAIELYENGTLKFKLDKKVSLF